MESVSPHDKRKDWQWCESPCKHIRTHQEWWPYPTSECLKWMPKPATDRGYNKTSGGVRNNNSSGGYGSYGCCCCIPDLPASGGIDRDGVARVDVGDAILTSLFSLLKNRLHLWYRGKCASFSARNKKSYLLPSVLDSKAAAPNFNTSFDFHIIIDLTLSLYRYTTTRHDYSLKSLHVVVHLRTWEYPTRHSPKQLFDPAVRLPNDVGFHTVVGRELVSPFFSSFLSSSQKTMEPKQKCKISDKAIVILPNGKSVSTCAIST